MGRKNRFGNFNTSVPCFIQEVHRGLDVFLASPYLPQPWPEDLPPILLLHFQILELEEAEVAMHKCVKESDDQHERIKSIVTRDDARWELKRLVGCVLRHVEATLRGGTDREDWPGYDEKRRPFPAPESAECDLPGFF